MSRGKLWCKIIATIHRRADLSGLTALAALAALATLNTMTLRRLGALRGKDLRVSDQQIEPRVSVLVPARNEAGNLAQLLPSLTAQDYPNLEIIVLDDCSTDQTFDVAQRWASYDKRLRVLKGTALPTGWLGKPYACAQLAAEATGTILVFTDADTRWAPDGIRLIVRAFAQTQADALSAWPEQQFSGILSKLVQPIQQWSLIAFLPIPLVSKRNRLAVAANGQLLAFRRDAYMRMGGHHSVKGSVIEDMALARTVKRHGLRFALLEATGIVSCQMYKNDSEMWKGLSKNIYPSLGASRLVLITLGALFAWLYLKPWVTLFSSTEPTARQRALLALLLGYWPRLLADLRFKAGPWLWWTHPLSLITWYGLALSSKHDYKTGQTTWKGRRYDLRGQ